MADLTTSYLGLKLKNPFILSSSGLTSTIESLKKAEEAGASAVVLKSLFEEDMTAEVRKMGQNFDDMLHPEAYAYLQETGMLYSADKYFDLIKQAKKELSIPVIASLNCYSSEWWTDYAETVEKTGADALELNIGLMAHNFRQDPDELEDKYVEIFKHVRSKIKIPISVKIGQNFTSIPNMVYRLHNAGADAVVMFNRFYNPDIDIDTMKMKTGPRFSTEAEFPPLLRWTAIIASQFDKLEISATTGIHSWQNAVKILMAGADTVQLCSVLYRKGINYLSTLIKEVEEWMDTQEYETLSEFQGSMESDSDAKEEVYERLQYLKSIREEI
ncbi:dihydroorotate dehydrogenase-like protein [Spirochaeta isovalerica]|uniref:dihydrouracil dehydrogenase (NAD(+)) n=1 Tax=Spirochaeta isovalerica TaxID=150 RepID=A0A841R4N7_9SPIO|nr:dihydroorotate dehydrogenase-like protein [Spirochaeta isovalerica]MBB6478776.1 dihydroorotate dehydrogenase (fumarate) [Spirochaeta isovalerica]